MSNSFWGSTTGELIGVAAVIFALTLGVGGCKFLEGISDSRTSKENLQIGFSAEDMSRAFVLGSKVGWDSANDGKSSTENCVFLMDKIAKTTDCPWWWGEVRFLVYGRTGEVTEDERNSD